MEKQIAEDAAVQGMTSDEYIFSRIAAGESHERIAKDYGVSRYLILRYCNHKDRAELYAEAKRVKAEVLVQEGLDILDESATATETAQVQAANNRAKYRQWYASKLNREAYGDDKQPAVNVNISSLHLGALQAHGHTPQLPEDT